MHSNPIIIMPNIDQIYYLNNFVWLQVVNLDVYLFFHINIGLFNGYDVSLL